MRARWALLPILLLSLSTCRDSGTGPGSPEIGAEGGTATLAGGAVTLSVPSRVLDAPVLFTAEGTSSVPEEGLLVPGSAYDVRPAGTTFSGLATLTVAYDPAGLPDGVRESELRLQRVSGGGWTPTIGSSVDPVKHVVSGKIESVGRFGAVALPATSLSLYPSRNTLAAGETTQIYLDIRGLLGQMLPDRRVTWTSGDEAVATVDASGLVTAVGGGITTITASVEALIQGVTVSVFDCSTQTSVPTAECLALIAIYDAYTNSEWRTATTMGGDPCAWRGVSCAEGSVAELVLGSTNGGSISYKVAELSNLTRLDLWSTKLVGSLPPTLGALAKLEVLSIHSSGVTGSIPPELGRLSNLRELTLSSNQLTGTIPAELGNLSALTELNLGWNQLWGTIPPELANLSNLTELSLMDNQLTGSIPRQLAGLAKLETLSLSFNQLTGGIPKELGSLSSLTRLGLSSNGLTGSIPAEIGNLSNLTGLYLSENDFSGVVPLAVARLGGKIQATIATYRDCQLAPQGNTWLSMPDTQDYRDADLDRDGTICGVTIGSQ